MILADFYIKPLQGKVFHMFRSLILNTQTDELPEFCDHVVYVTHDKSLPNELNIRKNICDMRQIYNTFAWVCWKRRFNGWWEVNGDVNQSEKYD